MVDWDGILFPECTHGPSFLCKYCGNDSTCGPLLADSLTIGDKNNENSIN